MNISKTSLTIAACQLPDIQTNIDKSLKLIINYAKEAERNKVELVCFPECFLQGYIVNQKTKSLAIDLRSKEFEDLLSQLSDIKPTLVIGLIEYEDGKLYNTAVVIKDGRLVGRYRKTHLLKGEQDVFTKGCDYPIFRVKNVKFGINICYDLNFPKSSKAIADQGAHLLICPSNNMMRLQTAEYWKDKHNEIRGERAKEGNLYLLSSDVTGSREGRVSYGPTALIDNKGKVIQQVPLGEEGLLISTIVV